MLLFELLPALFKDRNNDKLLHQIGLFKVKLPAGNFLFVAGAVVFLFPSGLLEMSF